MPSSSKRSSFRARHVFLLLIVAFIGVMIWKPVWRAEVIRFSTPFVRRGVEWAWNKARTWRPWERTAKAPGPVDSAESPVPQTAPEASPTDPSDPIDRSEASTPDSARHQTVGPEKPAEAPVVPGGNLPAELPVIAADNGLPAEIKALQKWAKSSNSPVTWRRLADAAAAADVHTIAAEAYRREAEIYHKQGDPNAAIIESLKAGQHAAEGRLYLHVPAGDPETEGLARLEPANGCLLGAFIDRDDQLPSTFMDENWQTHRESEEFEERIGKQHASYFCYLAFGRPFPFEWADRLKARGIIPHLAWEPKSLLWVDEASVERFAEGLARFDAPVFIRFAGEMNGDWTPYHDDPKLYRESFRLVHRIISRRAPKAALIWCVNTIPEGNIDAYYPGDDAVDWVGVNMYNVPFFDNDPSRPADHVHPADLLAHVYKKYAKKKPIAICEYAASHQSAIDRKLRPELAVTKIAQLYSALPRLYPRVKLVDWFDCNNLKHARAGRQLNNYSLTENAAIQDAYRRAVSSEHFLGRQDERPADELKPLKSVAVRGVESLSALVRAPVERPKVYVIAGDQVLYAGDQPETVACRWDTRKHPNGKVALRLLVLDRQNRLVHEQKQTVVVKNLPHL